MAARLSKARTKVLENLTILSEYRNKISATTTIGQISVRLEKLNELWIEFFDIESKMGEDTESQMEEFTDLFYETKATFVDFINHVTPKETVVDNKNSFDRLFEQQRVFLEGLSERTNNLGNTTNANVLGANATVRLPKISIEPFQGNYEAWPSFIDLFTSTVHENNSLSKAQKFQILKGLLKGGPADCVRDLLVTDVNYDSALKKLKDRYSKKKVILSTLISSFLEQPSATNGEAKSLRHLSDFSDEVLKGVEALGDDAEDRDPWLLHILLQKVDTDTQEAWALETVDEEFPKIQNFLDFLNKRCDVKESCALLNKKRSTRSSISKSHHTQETERLSCPNCKHPHNLSRCFNFKRMNSENKWNLVKKLSVCFNCLRLGHSTSTCSVQFYCKICGLKHHTLLHSKEHENNTQSSSATQSTSAISNTPIVNFASVNNSGPSSNAELIENNSQNVSLAVITKDAFNSPRTIQTCTELQCLNAVANFQTLLPTALAFVRDISGKLQIARVLIDSASTSSFVSQRFISRLGLRKTHCNRLLTGIGNTPAGSSKGIVSFSLHSRFNPEEQIEIHALVLEKVTSLIPSENVLIDCLDDLARLKLADPSFNTPSTIDILLGAEKALHIFTGEKFSFGADLIALSTIFGFVIGGQSNPHSHTFSSLHSVSTIDNINNTLQLFWNLEMPNNFTLSSFDAEGHFLKNVSRDSSGRLVVKLPFRSNHAQLGNSRKAAYCRLLAMERKFEKNKDFKRQYVSFMDEYIQLGHMSAIPPTSIDCPDSDCFYLPHHAVLKSDSLTTKLRVVFDGSCKSSSGVSLNEMLHIGPTIQPLLVITLLRFRLNSIAFTADVEKMYRQVLIHDDDKTYHRIVWREKRSDPVQHFYLNTVTYGTACAPYLAIRALQMVADDTENDDTTAAVLKTDFYVDDLLSGANDVTQASRTVNKLSMVMQSYGFQLRKWRSNSTQLLQLLPAAAKESDSLLLCECEEASIKTLGLHWNPARDTFHFKINLTQDSSMTKRKLVSQVARTFDPLGWLSPVTINMKAMIQQLWTEKLDWDDEIVGALLKKWNSLKQHLHELESIEIPRFIFASSSYNNAEMHGFCDASTTGYAAAVYIRSFDIDLKIIVRLLIAKTKVTPLKPITIPKLELCGALLLAELIQFIKSSREFHDIPVICWTDSQIVLAWLSASPNKWEQFVGNRCGKILDIVPRCDWRYVRSKDNSADIASRGVLPGDLVSNTQWWQGPHWLIDCQSNWPVSESLITTSSEANTAIRKSKPVLSCTSTIDINATLEQLFTDCSSFDKIIRVVAFLLKLSLPNRNKCLVGLRREAEILCFKYVQKQYFLDEIKCIKKNEPLPRKSKLISLTPFLDDNNVLRVRGRLQNSQLNSEAKHPVILPRDHVISQLLIRDAHLKHLHAGYTLLTNLLKHKVWIIDCKNLCKSLVNKCVSCIRQRAKCRSQLMGNMPEARVTPSRPFLYTGVDFAGPIYLKSKIGRGNSKPVKGYICLFICQCTKAIHLELVSALTTEAYIAALRRFISRRGIPVEIKSDNGRNFVGAKNELNELFILCQSQNFYKQISNFLSQNQIKFTFIPPRSPHFGGLWESNIKCVKYHLKRVCNSILSFEEMSTLLAQIEALLNSRPYVPTNANVDDLDSLTPGHFLIGAPLSCVPEPNLEKIPENRLSRWQNVQARVQSFWRRWSLEYLHTLQQRHKWQNIEANLHTGDIVIIKEENMPPSQWLMGRIIKLHPGEDSLVRVATVRTKSGDYNRPIAKLCLLLSSNADDQPKQNQIIEM